jgi:hypothetical protein
MYDIKRGVLLVDSRNGIYCPQVFAKTVNREMFPDIKNDVWSILEAGPEHEEYWDAWSDDVEGQESTDGATIYQDGDVWAVYEWNDENE